MDMLKRYIFVLVTMLVLPAATVWAEVSVGSLSGLTSALAGGDKNIKLTADIIVASTLTIPNGFTINGNGHTVRVAIPYLNEDGTTASNPSPGGVFIINSGSTVTLTNMTVIGGQFTDESSIEAAIFNKGTLTLDHVTMTRSHRGLSNSGSGAVAVLTNCVLIRNAAKYGGGLLNEYGQLLMDCCSFSENRTRVWGGGAAENRLGGKMYMNNVTMSNNYCDEQGAINNNNSAEGTNTYIMNSTITGNVTKATSGAVALNQVGGQVHVVNSIITDNYYLNGEDLEDNDVVGGNYAYCVVGSNNGGTLDENCKLTPSDEVFQSYAENGLYTGSGTTPAFSHTTLIESNGQYIAPVSPDGPAASGGTQTYFSYTINTSTSPPSLVVSMSYDKDGVNTSLGGLPTSDNLVTTNQDGTPRATTAPIPIGSAELSSPVTAYYTVSKGSYSNGTMTGVSMYGDSYASGTNITVTATPNSGYVLAGWDLNGSIRSTDNPYTFALNENTVVTPVFSSASTTIVCSIEDYEGQYDGNPHSISVHVTTPGSGYNITYSATEGGSYTTTNPTYTDIGTYTVYFKIQAAGYTDFSGSAIVKITQTITATDITVTDFVYNASAQNTMNALTVAYNGNLIPNTNYIVEPATVTEPGIYTLTITGRNNFTGVTMALLKVTKNMEDYSDDIKISASGINNNTPISTQIYKGASIHPTFYVYDKERLLTKDVDYTISYDENNTEGVTAGTITINGVGIYTGTKEFNFAIINEYFTEDNTDGVTISYHATSGTTASVGHEAPGAAIAPTTTGVVVPTTITHAGLTFQVTGIDDGAFKGCSVLRYIDFSEITGYTPSTLERTVVAAPFYGVPKQTLVYLNGTNIKGENYIYKVGADDYRCDVFKIYDDISGSQTGFTEDAGYKWSFENIHSFKAKNIVNTRKMKADQHYTICLPYDLSIPADTKAYTLKGANTANTLIGFEEWTGVLTKYTPYVLILSEAGQLLNVTNGTVEEFPGTAYTEATQLGGVSAGSFTMYGTMRYMDGADANGLYIMQGKDAISGVCTWKLIQDANGSYTDATNKYCVLPMRAYISHSGSPARQYLGATFTDANGETTVVEQLQVDGDSDDEALYDLMGRRIRSSFSTPKKGIYISKGHKVVR